MVDAASLHTSPPQQLKETSDPCSDGDGDHLPLSTPTIDELQERCRTLLKEVQVFAEYLKEQKLEHAVELAPIRNAVQSELNTLHKYASKPETDQLLHSLRSSNLFFYEAVWTTAKRSSGVVNFSKRIHWKTIPGKNTDSRIGNISPHGHSKNETTKKRRGWSVMVDIIAENGAEWIRVSTISESRLLFQLARMGWDRGDRSSDTEEEEEAAVTASLHGEDSSENDDEHDEISILRVAEELATASKATRIRYKHPRVHFVLPKIYEGKIAEVDNIIKDMRSTGALVETANTLVHLLVPTLESSLANMTIDEFAHLSQTLNLDCTVLLALVSDLSHARIVEEPWFQKMSATWLQHQIQNEEKVKLLTSTLYPVLSARPLVCTKEAAKRMREIVDTIGTDTEKRRMSILMGDQGLLQELLTEEWAKLSAYTTPSGFKMPIEIVDQDNHGDLHPSFCPRLAEKVADQLTPINQSVFLYGWRSGCTTLTSNRVVRQIETIIEENRGDGEEHVVGPSVWLCKTSRSLVGKEKDRKVPAGFESRQAKRSGGDGYH